jgi:hypothetical protein
MRGFKDSLSGVQNHDSLTEAAPAPQPQAAPAPASGDPFGAEKS